MAKSSIIGLDIGTTHVRAAEIEFSGGTPGRGHGTLVRYEQLPLPEGAVRDLEVVESSTVGAAIRKLWVKGGFGHKKVNIGIGNQRVFVRELDIPWVPMKDLRKALPYQATDVIPMAIDEALLDFYPTAESEGPNGKTLHGMLVAAVRGAVSANVLAANSGGLDIGIVDLNAFSLLRALTQGELRTRTAAVIDIGAKATNIVISEGGLPALVRILPIGGLDFSTAVANALDTSVGEGERIKLDIGFGYSVSPDLQGAADALTEIGRNLADAIRSTLAYYTTTNANRSIDLITLTGGGSLLPGFGQFLSTSSRIAVAVGNPLETLKVSRSAANSIAGNEAFASVAIGLAHGVA